MPPRRTPLTRRTGLPGPRVVDPSKAARARTGPTARQRDVVRDRAGGCCELCGLVLWTPDTGWVAPHSFHHRQPRGMGGSRVETHGPERLLLLCGTGVSGCHGRVETRRDLAYANGWLVKRPQDPADVPVLLHRGSMWATLTSDGGYA